jgi:pyruvate dehydrogenase E1 component alpha subunit
VYAATRQAVDRARAGEGPTLIEAVTYRIGPHSSADDPSRYRSAELTENWRQRDPIGRLRRYLETQGRWGAEQQEQAERDAAAEVERAIAAAEALPEFTAGEIFDAMFAKLPAPLAAQRQLAEEG